MGQFYQSAKKIIPGITRKEVSDFLKTQRVYTLHKPIYKPKVYRRVLVKGLGELYQADLVHLQKYSRLNKGFKYPAFIIDCFSKKLWVFKLKKKSGIAMREALGPFFVMNPVKKLQCDQGMLYLTGLVTLPPPSHPPTSQLALCKFFVLFFKLSSFMKCNTYSTAGTEFFNKEFKQMLRDLGVQLYHTNTDKKAQMVCT